MLVRSKRKKQIKTGITVAHACEWLATQEAEIRRIEVRFDANPTNSSRDPSWKVPIAKKGLVAWLTR
jgi:hypothetical protein